MTFWQSFQYVGFEVVRFYQQASLFEFMSLKSRLDVGAAGSSKCCGPSDSAHHEAARGQLRSRQRALQAPLTVLRQAPAARRPGGGGEP